MKLLSFVKELIEESSRPNKLITKFNDGNDEIILISVYHQWYERFGSKSFDEMIKLYSDNPKIRLGVPDDMIEKIFIKNFNKIKNKFDEMFDEKFNKSKKNPRIIAVKNMRDINKEKKNPKKFDFAEFLITKYGENKYMILTSAFSKDGEYLKTFSDSSLPQPKIQVEHINHSYPILYI